MEAAKIEDRYKGLFCGPARQSLSRRTVGMPPKVIQIPTLNDGAADFKRMFDIWSQVNDYFEDVRFDFSHCGFLRPNAVAFLGGLARLIESRFGTAVFDWNSLTDAWVKTTLRQNGFAGAFGDPSSAWDGNFDSLSGRCSVSTGRCCRIPGRKLAWKGMGPCQRCAEECHRGTCSRIICKRLRALRITNWCVFLRAVLQKPESVAAYRG